MKTGKALHFSEEQGLSIQLSQAMDARDFTLAPFKTVGFSLSDVELAGMRFTVTVQPGWTSVRVDGRRRAGPVRLPRSLRAVRLEFLK